MTLLLDEITTKKLILVRQLFFQAKTHARSQHNFVDRMMALIGFDLSVETLLKVIVGKLDAKHHTKNTASGKVTDFDLNFKQVVDRVEELLKSNNLSPLPPTSKIFHVRYLRNDAQHNAKYPNTDDLSDCETYTRDFHNEVIRSVWNQEFEDISLIELVKHDGIKDLLKKAAGEIKNLEFESGVSTCLIAFEAAKQALKKPLLGEGITSLGARDQITMQTFELLSREIETVRNYVLFILAGLDVTDHRKFRKIVEGIRVTRYTDGTFTVKSFDRAGATQTEADFVMQYVSNAVLKYEALASGLEPETTVEPLVWIKDPDLQRTAYLLYESCEKSARYGCRSFRAGPVRQQRHRNGRGGYRRGRVRHGQGSAR